MGAIYEFTGIVKKVNELQKFESGFEKQELVLTDDYGVQVSYPNIMCFAFKQERVRMLDGVKTGQRVKVAFAIDGREWKDKNGKVRYFTDLTGLKLTPLDVVEEPKTDPAAPTDRTQTDGTDDLPF